MKTINNSFTHFKPTTFSSSSSFSSFNTLIGFPRIAILLILSLVLTACGGGGSSGGGSSGGGASGTSGSNDITPTDFGITEFNVVPNPDNFIFSWKNPSNPTATISNYTVDATAYTTATGATQVAGAAEKLSRNIDYAGDNTDQDYTYTGLASGSYYEFFATANYADGESSKQIRLFTGRLVAGLNTDGDGLADGQDTDDDGDGDIDDEDNCPLTPNSDQNNTDGADDGGDACDEDDDNDGVIDRQDEFPRDASMSGDPDGDGHDSIVDVDDDGDGLIELATAVELDMMRHNLAGTGLTSASGEDTNSTGCGNGSDVTACSGYEQVANINLNDLVNEATEGANWQSIGGNCSSAGCTVGDELNRFFSATFDGNGYIISNMRIITQSNSAQGLFGRARNAILHNIHIHGGSISGSSSDIGGLVGLSGNLEVVGSSVILNSIQANSRIGGLIGQSGGTINIISSYAVVNNIRTNEFTIGGLVGGRSSSNTRNFSPININASYALVGQIPSSSLSIGGLVGNGVEFVIKSAYAIAGELQGTNFVAGLLGVGARAVIDSSYAITTTITTTAPNESGGLIGLANNTALASAIGIVGQLTPESVTASYWDNQTLSPVDNRSLDVTKYGSGRTTNQLHANQTAEGNFPDIYTEWADAYCNPTTGEYEETTDEDTITELMTAGFVRAWDLGTDTEYPVSNCTPTFTPAQQRAAITRILAGESPVPPELR